jgi:2-polyprenyl-6-methoxyphenol hydroxylase-like FAD-dependent oxidoreductase/LmbE family N-acetylglucosaminyl deacetylase
MSAAGPVPTGPTGPAGPDGPGATRVVRTPADAAALGTVLGVWAHPDDETYLSSGLMILARRAGHRVVCVTATRGEHGTSDPDRWPPERLARTRDHEVRAAMAVLGVDDHRILGLEDGTLADLDPAEGTRLVADLLADVRPDTIVTFGPDGMTGHPDHRAVAAWVRTAWDDLPAPRPLLLRATTTDRFARRFADVHAELDVFGPGLPLRTADAEVAVAVHLDDELQDTKLAALKSQATQVAPVLAAMGEDRFRSWFAEETFTQAVAVPDPVPDRPSRGSGRRRSTTVTARHDVAVVGARAAGAATAMLLARQGHDVVVVDRAEFPSDTLSTHAISRSGVVQLHRWGLLDAVTASGAPPIRKVTFHTTEGSVVRQVKPRAGVDHLVAPRRHVLDTLLAEAAADAGASVRLSHMVTGVRRGPGGRITGLCALGPSGEPVEIDARVVVGADGLRSRVARAVGAPVIDARAPGGATQYAYYGGTPWDGIEFFLGGGTFAGIFPTHGGEACIWVCAPAALARAVRRGAGDPAAAFLALLRRSAPALVERLAGAERRSAVRGAAELPNHARQAHGRGWALVGDAGYHRDPITGHGLSDAFRDAESLAAALDAGLTGRAPMAAALARYQAERETARAEIFAITCALSQFPPDGQFVELQRRLSAAIEVEATALAARPRPRHRQEAVA